MATQARQRRSAPQPPPARRPTAAEHAAAAENVAAAENAAAAASAGADAASASSAPAGDHNTDQFRAFYRDMLLVRRFEERAARAYTEALVGGYCHLNLGEEAAVVGLMAALKPADY